jgi:F-type H+-transporting ATPase subunit a
MSTDHSPLAQFEILPIVPLTLGGYDISFTNSSLWMTISVLFLFGVLFPAAARATIVPGRMQSVGEVFVGFIRDMLRDIAGKEALKYFPIVFTIFVFVLVGNLMGMIPMVSFTFTSHIAVTLALALLVFIGVTLIAIFKHGPIKFIKFFLPEGTPLWMAPLLFLIELFSYLSRPLSLSIRLAANMMAGHITMKVIAGLIVTFGVYAGWTMFPLLVFLTGFEIAIAFIQAYIFTILTCVYLNDALHLH